MQKYFLLLSKGRKGSCSFQVMSSVVSRKCIHNPSFLSSAPTYKVQVLLMKLLLITTTSGPFCWNVRLQRESFPVKLKAALNNNPPLFPPPSWNEDIHTCSAVTRPPLTRLPLRGGNFIQLGVWIVVTFYFYFLQRNLSVENTPYILKLMAFFSKVYKCTIPLP